MLPPVLETYVVWHPADSGGEEVADQILQHFHGTTFSGLIGGAVEVFIRSAGWANEADAPRALPFMADPPNGVAKPKFVAVVPVIGRELALTLEKDPDGAWHQYLKAVVGARSETVAVLPLAIDPGILDNTRLGELVGGIQGIGVPSHVVAEDPSDRRCRDLAQALAQFVSPGTERVRVFVSHTKRADAASAEQLKALIARTRFLISNTRLGEFFDENALQGGTDWAAELIHEAGRGALLALRTDLYASRRWCQNEMLSAKRAGVPVVILDALSDGEDRGSFLMDHVPRVPGGAEPSDTAILRALNQLVDECLKRALWSQQKTLAAERDDLEVAWWAPHAPEPTTLSAWLRAQDGKHSEVVRILHPDPPLGPDEHDVLNDIAALAGIEGRLEIMTPSGLAARGG